jgi:hypothetical protein
MSTYPLGEFVVSTVYLVVTVTVNRHQVAIPVVAVIAIEVMGFDQGLQREDESTRFAVDEFVGYLPLERLCKSAFGA